MSNVTEGIKVENEGINVVDTNTKVKKPGMTTGEKVAAGAAVLAAAIGFTAAVFGDSIKSWIKNQCDKNAINKLEKIRDEKDEKKRDRMIKTFKKKYRVDPEAIIAEYGENLYQLRF